MHMILLDPFLGVLQRHIGRCGHEADLAGTPANGLAVAPRLRHHGVITRQDGSHRSANTLAHADTDLG